MKAKMILKTGMVLVLIAFTSGTIKAYHGNKQTRGAQLENDQRCINQLTGLTDEQKEKIAALEEAHQLKMEEFRNERRATTDLKQKEDIRAKMINQRDNHRKEVSSLLTPDQQKELAQFHQTPARKYQQVNGNKGNGKGNGCNARSGRGGNGNNGRGHGNGNNSGNGCRR